MDKRALRILASSDIGIWRGRNVCSYKIPDLPTHDWIDRFDRKTLHAFCRDRNNLTKGCALAVLAWGGARADHVRTFWKSRGKWCGALNRLRDSRNSREEDYDCLAKVKSESGMPGVGPAYFTKFLWFMRPTQDAYIMDQWTSRSILALLPESAPKTVGCSLVSNDNCGQDYERYCLALEAIAERLAITPERCEQKMFSQGGRHPLPWRCYLRGL